MAKKNNFKPTAAMRADFEALLNGSFNLRKGFEPGEKVTCSVIAIRGGEIILDVNAKNEGKLPASELSGKEVKAGDKLDLFFVTVDNGAFLFTAHDASAPSAAVQSLSRALATGLPVEGKVTAEVKGGYEVSVNGERAFCPYSQINLFKVENAVYVGKVFTFAIQEFNAEDKNLVVSRRIILEREREERLNNLKASLKEGESRVGKVTRITDFGFFVDLGGAEGLVPLKELSYVRGVKPSDLVSEGDSVEVLIVSIDWEKNRISLSLRATKTDPFDTIDERFPVGSEVLAKVTHLERFGAFAELEPGIEGLIPIGSLGNGRHITRPDEVVSKGMEVLVKVESIDHETRRIRLALAVADKRTQEDDDKEAAAEAARAIEEAKAIRAFKENAAVPQDFGTIGSLFDSLK